MKSQDIKYERIAIFGAGSAGLGIANLIIDYLIYIGVKKEEAYKNIYLIDKEGLLTDGPFGKNQNFKTLEEVAAHFKITTLIGASAQPRVFTERIISQMMKATDRPIIFPLSNPNSKSEADPADLAKWTNGAAIVATGSPFPNTPQCNNVCIFPAFGLLASTTYLKYIPNDLFIIAAIALSKTSDGKLFPDFKDLRKSTKIIAGELQKNVIAQNLALTDPLPIDSKMWFPDYESTE